jgi:hypothetical protein
MPRLVAFDDHGRKGVLLFYSSVPDTTRNIIGTFFAYFYKIWNVFPSYPKTPLKLQIFQVSAVALVILLSCIKIKYKIKCILKQCSPQNGANISTIFSTKPIPGVLIQACLILVSSASIKPGLSKRRVFNSAFRA